MNCCWTYFGDGFVFSWSAGYETCGLGDLDTGLFLLVCLSTYLLLWVMFCFYASRYLFLRCLFFSLFVFSHAHEYYHHHFLFLYALRLHCSNQLTCPKFLIRRRQNNLAIPPNACCNNDPNGVIMSPYGIGFLSTRIPCISKQPRLSPTNRGRLPGRAHVDPSSK